MRLNLPVVDQEYPFPSGESLVSTTDLQGRILHCNSAFVEVSGYSREELMGQPHNLIRHPDMPPEAFADMWQTIASGSPWLGLVKNRRKDGSHYWVQANVTPLMDGDSPVGYMSVRTEPSREQVQAAQALYEQMRHAPGSIALRAGRVQPRGLARVAALWPRLNPLSSLALFALLMGIWALPASWSWAAPLAALVAALGYNAALTRHEAQGLRRICGFANRLAAGDLSSQVPVSGNLLLRPLEGALSQLSVNMRALVSDTQQELQRMMSVSQDLSQGNQDLAARTEAQSASLEQTAASTHQIQATASQNTETTMQAVSSAERVSSMAKEGADVVASVHETMAQIAKVSDRIADISQTIDGIAFQTNLLALNAAVEAARAGDHGKGFAVVASEVRALSQRCSTAAREIRQLTQRSTAQMQHGTSQAEQARSQMSDTLGSVQHINSLLCAIQSTAREQLSGVSQIHEAICQMDGITQQNAGLVDKLADAAVQLSDHAQSVQASLAVFKLGARQQSLGDAVALRRQAKAKQLAEAA
ncbi:methyl-accepting chemotaxis protein [Roseateles sp. BYS180W]|uniref:Methyl-accepting chemotaxis protein n=1 Tax=Roseateles rivi TaxID=3299028 RepID=A0ABW7FXV8_9BURK